MTLTWPSREERCSSLAWGRGNVELGFLQEEESEEEEQQEEEEEEEEGEERSRMIAMSAVSAISLVALLRTMELQSRETVANSHRDSSRTADPHVPEHHAAMTCISVFATSNHVLRK